MRIRRGLAVCGFLTGALGSQAAGAGETLMRLPVDATSGQVPADIARIALARGVPDSGCIPRLDVASFRVRERRVAK